MPESPPPPPKNWKKPAAIAGVAVIGIVFVLSAAAKLSTIGAFEIQLVKQGIFADRATAMWPARILSAIELAVGIGLLQPNLRKTLFSTAAGAMLIAFSAWLSYLLLAGKPIEDCGCFGDLLKMSPAVALARNVTLFAILALAWRHLTDRANFILPGIIIVASLVATGIAAPPKQPPAPAPLDSPSQKTSPFAQFSDFSNGEADVTKGARIITFLSLDCEHCQQVAMQLAGAAPDLPPIFAVYLGDPSQVPDFEGMSGSAFPWTIPDPGTFFDFIGEAPPRTYLLQDGNTVKHWDEEQFSIEAVIDSLPQ